jgi:hypothetical protein
MTTAIARDAQGVHINWPITGAMSAPNHQARVDVQRVPHGGAIVRVADTGPRGGRQTLAATVSSSGVDAVRAEVRPQPTVYGLFGLSRDVVGEHAADTAKRLATIEQAVEMLTGSDVDVRKLAEIRPIIAEVSELLARALTHAVPEMAEEN